MSDKASASALSGGLRTQIRQMSERDGISSDEISTLLGVPSLIVEEVLRGGVAKSSSTETDSDELTGRVRNIEDRVGEDAVDDAINTLRELCLGSDSDAVRSMAAQKLIEYRAGSLRPKTAQTVNVGVTVDTMNVLIQQAVAAHAAQLAAPQVPSETISLVDRN